MNSRVSAKTRPVRCYRQAQAAVVVFFSLALPLLAQELEDTQTLTLLTYATPDHMFSYHWFPGLTSGEQIQPFSASVVGTGNEKLKIAGIDPDLMAMFAAEQGRSLRIRNFQSLDDMFTALEEGDGDVCAAGLVKTPKRSAVSLPSEPYYRASAMMVVFRRGQKYESKKSLEGARIGVVRGSVFQETLENEVPSAQLVESDMHLENLVAVDEEQLDFTLMASDDVEQQFARNPDLKNALDTEQYKGELTVHVFFSKSNSELVERFNSFLRSRTEEVEGLIQKHSRAMTSGS